MDYHSDRETRMTYSDRGDEVARAKRTDRATDRAEARRKYRAYLQAQEEAAAAAANVAEEPAPAPRRSLFGRGASPAPVATTARPKPAAAAAAATPTPGAGMNFFKAMSAAYRPVHYRDDLRYLPTLFTKTIGVWIGLGLAAVGTIVAFNDPAHDMWVGLAQLCIGAMPLGAVMIVGVLTKRAAWLAGLIVGGVGGFLGWIVAINVPANWYDPSLTIPDLATRQGYIMEDLMAGLAFGALFGAASAWYRRFLTLAMPPSNNRGGQSKRASRNARPAKKTR